MVKKCHICDKETEKTRKTSDGYVCKDCLDNLPRIIVSRIKEYKCDEIENFILYFKGFKQKSKFASTLEVKNIAIDEVEGLIMLKNKRENNIFDIMNVKSEAFSIDYKHRKGRNAVVDIYFSIEFDEPKVRFNKISVGRHTVPIEESDDTLIIGLPYSIQFFENAIISCNHRKIDEYNYNLEHGKNENFQELLKAKGLFLIDDTYDLSYIKEYRNKMVKLCHPDNNPNGAMPELVTAINDAYYLLKKELE